MEVSGQFHALAALSLGKETSVPIAQKAEPSPEMGLDKVLKRKVLFKAVQLSFSAFYLLC
jgi:hypothetical protein